MFVTVLVCLYNSTIGCLLWTYVKNCLRSTFRDSVTCSRCLQQALFCSSAHYLSACPPPSHSVHVFLPILYALSPTCMTNHGCDALVTSTLPCGVPEKNRLLDRNHLPGKWILRGAFADTIRHAPRRRTPMQKTRGGPTSAAHTTVNWKATA